MFHCPHCCLSVSVPLPRILACTRLIAGKTGYPAWLRDRRFSSRSSDWDFSRPVLLCVPCFLTAPGGCRLSLRDRVPREPAPPFSAQLLGNSGNWWFRWPRSSPCPGYLFSSCPRRRTSNHVAADCSWLPARCSTLGKHLSRSAAGTAQTAQWIGQSGFQKYYLLSPWYPSAWDLSCPEGQRIIPSCPTARGPATRSWTFADRWIGSVCRQRFSSAVPAKTAIWMKVR